MLSQRMSSFDECFDVWLHSPAIPLHYSTCGMTITHRWQRWRTYPINFLVLLPFHSNRHPNRPRTSTLCVIQISMSINCAHLILMLCVWHNGSGGGWGYQSCKFGSWTASSSNRHHYECMYFINMLERQQSVNCDENHVRVRSLIPVGELSRHQLNR